ncbi:MAG TPA: hypothetical protein PK189_10440, partial [bacterium]|nr:hypothetical protein [bacterium]
LKDLLNTSYNKVLELIEYLDNLKDDFDYYENEIFNKYKESIIKNKNEFINKLNNSIKERIMQIRKEFNCKELYIHNDKSKKCEEHSKYCAKNNKLEKVPKEFSEGDTITVCTVKVSSNLSKITEDVINCIKETEVDIFKKDYTHFAIGTDIDQSLTNIYITIRFIKLF